MRSDLPSSTSRGTGLVDVLDRVLDKGLVVAGDIKVSLAEVELLTIRIRLLVCSIDKAQEIGLDWWRYDAYLAPGKRTLAMEAENAQLKKQIAALERRITQLAEGQAALQIESGREGEAQKRSIPRRTRRGAKGAR